MQYKTLKEDFYWESTNSAVTSITYTISDGDYVFYYGRAVKSPSDTYVRINVSRIIRDYLENDMPDFRDYDGVVVNHPDAMKTFVMRYATSGIEMASYKVLMDYEDVWGGGEMLLSEPVNAHADPRQKIFFGACSKDAGDITIDVPSEYDDDYLTFEVLSGGTLRWVCNETGYERSVSYSKDGGETWTTITSVVEPEGGDAPTLRLNAGDIVKWRGAGPYGAHAYVKGSYFWASSDLIINVYGNIASMSSWERDYCPTYQFLGFFSDVKNIVSAENLIIPYKRIGKEAFLYAFTGCEMLEKTPKYLPASIVGESGYANMFAGCESITSMPDLPAMDIGEFAYEGMFAGCTNLTSIPRTLPALVLQKCCYAGMFGGCESLTEAPVLPATILADGCYSNMFVGCIGLTKAPDLPAPRAVNNCYFSMLRDCENIAYIKCLLTSFDSAGSDFLTYWVENVSPTGTFYKDPSVSVRSEDNPNGFWPVCVTGLFHDSGIPCGWDVEDA